MDNNLLTTGMSLKSNLLEKELNRHRIFDCKVNIRESCIAYIDGSYCPNVHKYGFGAVLAVGNQIFETNGCGDDTELVRMRNITGELLGCMYAVKWCIANGIKVVDIYYDYAGIECWANGAWKTKKKETKEYKEYIEDMRSYIDINFIKVKSHSGNVRNNMADRLAKEAVAGIIVQEEGRY